MTVFNTLDINDDLERCEQCGRLTFQTELKEITRGAITMVACVECRLDCGHGGEAHFELVQ